MRVTVLEAFIKQLVTLFFSFFLASLSLPKMNPSAVPEIASHTAAAGEIKNVSADTQRAY